MIDSPLVTVAMVTYNSEAYVSVAIESVLNSSYENLELIICDDCSSDNTWSIVSKYTDPRIRARRNSKNIGEYPNRNQCINISEGEYFIFIDGDDFVYPHGLEYMIRMLRAFPECGMAIMYPYDERVILPMVISPEHYYQNYYFGKGLLDVAFANTLFRTEILKRFGGLPNNYRAGDDYIRLLIAASYPTLIISDQLTWWRKTPGQASEQLRNNSVVAIAEIIMMSKQLLLSDRCPMKPDEKDLVKMCLAYKIKLHIRKSLKNLRFRDIARLLTLKRELDIHFKEIIFSRFINMDPFSKYTAAKPYQLDIHLNPFAAGKKRGNY